MEIEYLGFGAILIDGVRYDRDVLIDGGRVRPRTKKASRHRRSEFGHTPLTAAEDLPWRGERLVVGTGYSGRLPITVEVEDEARRRGVELICLPTAEACALLRDVEPDRVFAVLHLTC